ncbi:hypothetical protein SLEP1_g29458 [Rubroshorea leprosula]|uniref:Transposase (putative) gypsy type domain-containing protein n=1 Tax=Rubroshorea leprosula TaxID=152421 RepID=A0AAV5JWZ1_9ROSI|nr:hypothetical protein SLEP1_g29458 [Rubroshorea leprosula]
MASFHDAQEFWGNQGGEDEVDVLSVELIAMIVPSELQDSPRTATPESSASSSAGGGSNDHRPSTSSDSTTEETPSEAEGVEEVGCSAPAMSTEAEVVLFEGAALHHEVADGAATVKGYKKLEEMVRRYQIPRTVLIRAGTPNEWACSVSRTGWVPIYVDHFDADLRFPLPGLIFDVLTEYELALPQLTPNSIKFIIGFMLLCERLGMLAKVVVFRSLFLCRLCPSTSGTIWYYISGREKMMIFTNIRNKVARWKRQFVFIRETRTERVSNELAARLSEWRTPNTYMNYLQLTVGDVDLKNWLLEEMSSILERQRQRARGLRNRGAGSGSQRQTRFDERPPAAPGRNSSHGSSNLAPRLHVEQRVEPTPSSSRRRAREDFDAEDDIPLIQRRTMGPRISYPDSFSYVKTDCQATMLQGMQNFVPPANQQRAKGHVQQHGGHAALIKLMDAFSYTVTLFECDQGARSSKMANRAASAESRADELARKVNELKEDLERAQTEKKSSIQAAKEEAGRAEDRAKKAKSNKEKTLHELSALRERALQADQHVARVKASLERTKRFHQRDVCFARAQGAKWLVGVEMFQDAVVVASANTTTDIFNEVRGKVLQVRADFPIGELAFLEGEEIDEEGKGLTQPIDTQVRLKWELNEEGLPMWPPTVVEEGVDTEGLPSFNAWVADPHDVPAEPSSTPPSAQPASAAALAPFPLDRPSPARSISVPNDASIPINLTDD